MLHVSMTGITFPDSAFTAALAGGTQINSTVGATVGDANYIKLLMLSFAIGIGISLVMYVIYAIRHPKR